MIHWVLFTSSPKGAHLLFQDKIHFMGRRSMLEHTGSRKGGQMKIKYDNPDVWWLREETRDLYVRLNTTKTPNKLAFEPTENRLHSTAHLCKFRICMSSQSKILTRQNSLNTYQTFFKSLFPPRKWHPSDLHCIHIALDARVIQRM